MSVCTPIKVRCKNGLRRVVFFVQILCIIMICSSSYRTTDSIENLSIEYQNIYAINGRLVYLTTEQQELPYVNKFTNAAMWRPDIKIFANHNELTEYVSSLQVNNGIEQIELAAIGDNWWHHNIGHALFDGLYPLYLALVKFGYADKDFLLISDNFNKNVMAYDIINKFSGHTLMEHNSIDKKVIRFQKMVAGTGSTGNRVMNKNYTLYGEKEYGALTLFKHRMLGRHGVQPDKPLGTKLKIVIINNIRYTQYETQVLNDIVEYYNKDAGTSIEYLDWSKCKSFTDQMKILEDVDIHISGPGTGIMYMPFLKKGAININLGYMEHTQTNGARHNIKILCASKDDYLVPGWMEQSVCSGASYVSTLYYDRFKYNRIETDPLIALIEVGRTLIEKKEIQKNNLNIDALVFVEYCKRVPDPDRICNHLTSIAFFIELFVNEHPHTLQNNVADLQLLRNIKDEMNFDRRYEIKI